MKPECQSGSLGVGGAEGSQWRSRSPGQCLCLPLCIPEDAGPTQDACLGQLRTAQNLAPWSSSLIVRALIRTSMWGQVSEGNKQCTIDLCNRTGLPCYKPLRAAPTISSLTDPLLVGGGSALFSIWNRASLCSPDNPEIPYADQADLELTKIFLSLPPWCWD